MRPLVSIVKVTMSPFPTRRVRATARGKVSRKTFPFLNSGQQ